MTVAVRQSSGARKAANIRALTSAGLKGAETGRIRTAAGLVSFFSKFAVSVDHTGASAGFNSGGATTLTTRTVTATVAGAVGDTTYLWTQTGGDPMTITSPNTAATAFQALVNPGETLTGTFKCTVTDGGGHSGDTPIVTAVIANHYGGLL